jgi:hypothetical protein
MKNNLCSRRSKTLMCISIGSVLLVGCNRSAEDTANVTAQHQDMTPSYGIDITQFVDSAFVSVPEVVDCKTSAGTETTCYKLVTAGAPAGREPGDFCPRNVTDGAETTGSWFSKDGEGDLVDLTGEFIANLSTYYNDSNWKLHDSDTGVVRYTATKEACLGAAKPDVEEQYKQNCIECQLSYLDDDFTRTFLIPTHPIKASRTERVHTVGIALDGSELSGPAPVNDILGSYTIAAFDDCGGHINVHQGYHYHASTGCTDKTAAGTDDGYAPLIGYAADGFAIYAMKDAAGNEAEMLDECRGTTDSVRGYHYRAASPSENMMIGCLQGEVVQSAQHGQPPQGPGPRPGNPPADKA